MENKENVYGETNATEKSTQVQAEIGEKTEKGLPQEVLTVA